MFSLLRLLLLSVVVGYSASGVAQCGLTVVAGPDRAVCASGGSVVLQGAVSGPDLINFRWSPETGLSDPTSLTPTATVSGPTTYTLSGFRFDPATNLIVNGDFSAGPFGFTTQYLPGLFGGLGPLTFERTFRIATDPSATHDNFAACGDHTTGSGNMMVVNGATTPNESVWCQTITVTPGLSYAFSAWIQSVISENPALLQFSVNGELLGTAFRASSTVCNWEEFNEVWTAGATTNAEICIVNQNTVGSGNDFAIDDLFFGEVCEQTDEVDIILVPVNANLATTVGLPCNAGPAGFQLDGSASSSGANYFYQWDSPDGNIVSGGNTATPTVNQTGTYELTVSYDDGITFCTDQAIIVVTEDPNIPEAFAETLEDLSCANPETLLTAVGSTSGGDIDYQWTTSDGFIVSGGNSSSPTVSARGTYNLLVTHLPSGCTALAATSVGEDRQDPVVSIRPPQPLGCSASSQQLDANDSEAANNITASWTTSGGNFVSGTDGLEPTIDAPGSYTLTLENTDNGCTVDSTVVVTQVTSSLSVSIPPADTLTCQRTAVTLTGSAAGGANYTFAWTSTDGQFTGATDAAQLSVDSAGTYILEVTDGTTGCSRFDTVVVADDLALPNLALTQAPPFTCVRAQQILQASSSDPGLDLRWTSSGGSILNDTFSLQPTVKGAGEYTLTATNPRTGCQTERSITIGENITPPIAVAGLGFQLNCGQPSDTLDGRASAQSPVFRYLWTTENGSILADTFSLRPVISAAGNYVLSITDTLNGCVGRDTVFITRDDAAPTITIAPADTLNCQRNTTRLNASGTDFGNGFTINWSTPDGTIASGSNGLTPTVSTGGTYTLRVENTANNCPAERSITVVQDTLAPMAEAGIPFRLDCFQDTLPLNPLGAALGDTITYSWSTSNGHFVGATDVPSPEVDSAGRYFVLLRNNVNNCTAIDSVEITADFVEPALDLTPSLRELNCRDSVVILNAGFQGPATYRYQWLLDGPFPLAGDTLAELRVNAAGVYGLEITDLANGCTSLDFNVITADTIAPVIAIAEPPVLDCERTELRLNAGNSSPGSIGWRTEDGQFLTDTDGLEPLINAPGTYRLRLENPANGCVDSASVTVRQNILPPVADAGVDRVLNCYSPTGILDGSNSTPGDTIAYRWTLNGNLVATSPTTPVTVAGRYFVLLRNNVNNCTARDSVEVTEDQQAPTFELGDDRQLTCDTLAVTLGAVAGAMNGLNYQWSFSTAEGADTTDVFPLSVSEPGLYDLRVTSTGNGCFATDGIRVTQDTMHPLPFVGTPPELTCARERLTLLAAPPPPGSNWAFQWSTTDGNIVANGNGPSAEVNQAGNYQLLVTDRNNGCTDSLTTTVNQDTLHPLVTLPEPPVLDCETTSFSLNGSFSQAGPDPRFGWAFNGMGTGVRESSILVSEAGVYRLQVSNTRNSCTATATVTVLRNASPPSLSAPPVADLDCRDQERNLSVMVAGNDAHNYTWTTSTGNILSGNNTALATVNAPGSYRVTVRNTSNECTSEITVDVGQNIIPPTVNAGPDFNLGCTTEPQRLGASASGQGALAYRWNTVDGDLLSGGTTATPLIGGSGTYTLTVIDAANGCSAMDEIRTFQSLLESFAFEKTDPDCSTPTANLRFTEVVGGTDPFVYSLDGGASFSAGPSVDSIAPGRYELIVQDANGCELSEVITVPAPPELILALPGRVVIELGDNYVFNPRTNFTSDRLALINWSPETELSCTDCLRPTATPAEATTYVLQLESVDGCTATDSTRIIVDRKREIYFPTAFSPNGDGVNDLYLPFGDPKRIRSVNDFEIFDRWGNNVFSSEEAEVNADTGGWDGRHQGRVMNPAVFVYTARVVFVDGRAMFFKGEFSLVR